MKQDIDPWYITPRTDEEFQRISGLIKQEYSGFAHYERGTTRDVVDQMRLNQRKQKL